MERSKQAGMVGKMAGSRWLSGMVVSLIVLGGAISVGSALAKRDNSADSPGKAVGPWWERGETDGHNGNGTGNGTGTPATAGTHIVSHLATEGTSSDQNLSFELKDWSFGVENPTTIGSATGGAGAGKIMFNEFTINKTIDVASPLLFKNCATGEHYKKVILELRKVNNTNASDSNVFLRFQFSTVFTTKITWSGPGDEGPEESITFVYGQLQIEYTQQNTTNSTVSGWDQVQNKAWDPSA